MFLYHTLNAQMMIYQYCKFQKALFVKILPTLHFMLIKGGYQNFIFYKVKTFFFNKK
jgi:hypothetical protein